MLSQRRDLAATRLMACFGASVKLYVCHLHSRMRAVFRRLYCVDWLFNYRHVRIPYYLHLQDQAVYTLLGLLNPEDKGIMLLCDTGTLVTIYHSTRCNTPEDMNLHQQHYKNLMS